MNQDISTELKIHLVPRSSRDQLVNCTGDQLKIKITAPPVEGRANQALIAFLAKQLGIAKTKVELVAGATSKQKKIRIHGLTLNQIHDRLKQ
ncbi:MAG: YggU family protein [Desulfobacteraceae bacterium]|nr:MAG: YggU family protein [Desulfobacteraceae bacterium]